MGPYRSWPSLAVLIAELVFVGLDGILAQTTDVVCLSTFNWMDNSKGQNPCLVGAYLQGACDSGQFNVGSLEPGNVYVGPYVDQVNECQCSSVTYNTISACGLCQNHSIVSWSAWNTNCTTIYPGVFALGIPSGTAVPQWAFQNVTASNFFDATLAEAVGDTPESTATRAQSTGAATPTPSSSVSASLTASPSDPTSTISSSTSSHTGAIAGGVVGGVAGVALIVGAIVFLFLKKKRSQIPPSAQYAASMPSPHDSGTTPLFPQMAQPRLYDPSDPSTYPATPPPLSFPSDSLPAHGSVTSYPSTNYSAPVVQPHYHGVAEV